MTFVTSVNLKRTSMIAKHRVTSLLYYSGSLSYPVIIEDYGFKRVNHFLSLK
jgi:hypothetical protein